TIPIESQQIIQVMTAADHHLKISEIENLLAGAITRRTLQRRLFELKRLGFIQTQGTRAGTEYFLAETKEKLPLSKIGQQLKEKVAQPLIKRKPVPYNVEFLFSYQPNKTFYLTETIKSHLLQLGQQFHQKLTPGTYAKRILHRLLIDLSWNSSRLEGNTYSLLETQRLIEYGALANGKNAIETQMIMNHKDAIEFMVEQADTNELNKYVLMNIHALLSNNLLANPRARGQLRQIPVGIGKTVYYPPEIPQIIHECFERIIMTVNKIKNPFEQAFFLMVQLPYLQPFEDVNKRVSRLAANIPLIQNNLSPLSFIDVPKSDYISGLLAIYELNQVTLMRDVFVWAYERSAQHYQLMQDTLGSPDLVAMRYKQVLVDLVSWVITHHIHGKAILDTIAAWSKKHVDRRDQVAFCNQAEREIASLHEGNIAVYRIEPDLFRRWKK
ncbi:MAG: hypothetical protein ACD_70C00208G0001, partial [uncultured bacterium]